MPRILRLLSLIIVVSCATDSVVKYPIQEKSFYDRESSVSWVQEAIDIANCITVREDFHQGILNNGPFEHYDGSNKNIVKKLISDKRAKVGTYYKRFTKAIAYRNIGSDKIWFNRYKAKISTIYQKANTMIHERLHVLGFGHKGNSKYKYNNVESVPYKVGKIGEKYAKECQKSKK